jgi:uncharacterized protein YecT (DUF1311 family)
MPLFKKLIYNPATVALVTGLAATASTSCSFLATKTKSDPVRYARVEDYPEYEALEKRLHEAYEEAASRMNKQQRTVLEKDQKEWASEREKERGNPDAFIADTEQNVRNLSGYYDEPY